MTELRLGLETAAEEARAAAPAIETAVVAETAAGCPAADAAIGEMLWCDRTLVISVPLPFLALPLPFTALPLPFTALPLPFTALPLPFLVLSSLPCHPSAPPKHKRRTVPNRRHESNPTVFLASQLLSPSDAGAVEDAIKQLHHASPRSIKEWRRDWTIADYAAPSGPAVMAATRGKHLWGTPVLDGVLWISVDPMLRVVSAPAARMKVEWTVDPPAPPAVLKVSDAAGIEVLLGGEHIAPVLLVLLVLVLVLVLGPLVFVFILVVLALFIVALVIVALVLALVVLVILVVVVVVVVVIVVLLVLLVLLVFFVLLVLLVLLVFLLVLLSG